MSVPGKPFQLSLMFVGEASGLYYKRETIVNFASSGVNKLRATLNDDARVVIYDHHMFIVQATGAYPRVAGLTRKHQNRLEMLVRDKHSSLLQKSINYDFKSLILQPP